MKKQGLLLLLVHTLASTSLAQYNVVSPAQVFTP